MAYAKCLSMVLVFGAWLTNVCLGVEVGQWKRFEVQVKNDSWQGNPFDVVLEGVFTSPSGRTVNHFGFYAGKDTWKIYFMPDEVGNWAYQAHYPDLDIKKKSGEFTCVKSNLDPPLMPEGNGWRLTGSKSDFPVIWNPPVPDGKHWGFRGRDLNTPEVQEALRFSEEVVGARFLTIGELFIAPINWAKDWPQSAVPYVVGKEGDEFSFPFWDQLNAKMDAARDRNMGAYIMLYSDDALTPDNFGLTPRSEKELRLFRYVMARLACYPHILWDSGIDLSEYRNNNWVNWYIDWFAKHDPWHHPVGSRTGGGSGGVPQAAATYYSLGGASIPSRAELLKFDQMDVPIAHTDHWRPFIGRGNWTHDKLRIAHWRCALSGAQALLPDYNQGPINIQQMKIGAKYIGHATRFFRNAIRSDLSELQPHDDLIVDGKNAILAANLGKEYVVYDEDGGELKIDLTSASGTLTSQWYNPRTGEETPPQKIKMGQVSSFNSPTSKEDWVLHLYNERLERGKPHPLSTAIKVAVFPAAFLLHITNAILRQPKSTRIVKYE